MLLYRNSQPIFILIFDSKVIVWIIHYSLVLNLFIFLCLRLGWCVYVIFTKTGDERQQWTDECQFELLWFASLAQLLPILFWKSLVFVATIDSLVASSQLIFTTPNDVISGHHWHISSTYVGVIFFEVNQLRVGFFYYLLMAWPVSFYTLPWTDRISLEKMLSWCIWMLSYHFMVQKFSEVYCMKDVLIWSTILVPFSWLACNELHH